MKRPGQALHTAAQLGMVGREGDGESWGCRDRGGSSRSPSLCPVRRPGLQGSQARPWEGLWELELTGTADRTACGRVCARPAVTAPGGNHAGTVAKVHVTQVRVTEPRCARALLHHAD